MTEHGVCPSEEIMEYEEEIARLRQSNGKLVQAILDHKAINAELLKALKALVECNHHYDDNIRAYCADCQDKAEAAIRRAEGTGRTCAICTGPFYDGDKFLDVQGEGLVHPVCYQRREARNAP